MKTSGWILLPALFCVSATALLGSPRPHGALALAADAVPDAAAIRAKIRAAAGPVPAAFRETDETIAGDGSKTIEHDYRRDKDYRFVFDTGRFHTENGMSNGDAWHMNDNGQVVIDQPDPGEATGDPTTTTVAAVHKPVEGYVISTLNARGYGTKEYVDGTAWVVVRRERVLAAGTIVYQYDDVRADHGRTFAHHVHTDNGYAHTTSDLRITEYLPDDVAAADVAIPSPRRALVTFPAGVSSVQLPAKFGRSHIYVRVTIGARGLDFVLDSGASGITIDATVARELGLPEFAKHQAVTAARYTTARTIVPEMRVGELVMRDVAVQEIPHGWNTDPDVKEVGLLGFDFLAELGVTIDYEHERVTVVPGDAYAAPADKSTIVIPVRIGSGSPRATVQLNGAVGERWVLDTGGSGTFLIFDYFARRHPEALSHQGNGGAGRTEMRGVGGIFQTQPYQISSLKLANVNFKDFIGYRVTDNSSYAQNDDGIIGVDFLRLFTVGFDYGNSRVYLVPNGTGRRAMGIR